MSKKKNTSAENQTQPNKSANASTQSHTNASLNTRHPDTLSDSEYTERIKAWISSLPSDRLRQFDVDDSQLFTEIADLKRHLGLPSDAAENDPEVIRIKGDILDLIRSQQRELGLIQVSENDWENTPSLATLVSMYREVTARGRVILQRDEQALTPMKFIYSGPQLTDTSTISADDPTIKTLSAIPFIGEFKKFDVTRKVNRARKTGINPFVREFPSIERLLDLVSRDEELGLLHRYEKLKRQMLGETPINGVYRSVDDYRPDGAPRLATLLASYAYKMNNLPASLPLGKLGSLSTANRQTFAFLAEMLLRRYTMMGTLPDTEPTERTIRYFQQFMNDNRPVDDADPDDDSFSYSSVLTNAFLNGDRESWPLITDREAHTAAVNGQASLGKLYSRAVERQMVNMYITPLLRSVLVDRGRITSIVPQDLLDNAITYASWVKRKNAGVLKQSIISDISDQIVQQGWIRSMIMLQQFMVQAIPSTATTVMSMLGTYHPDWARQTNPYWQLLDNDDDLGTETANGGDSAGRKITRLQFKSPFGLGERRAELFNVRGEVLGVRERFTDVFSPTSTDETPLPGLKSFSDITPNEITLLIRCLVKLDERSLEQTPDFSALSIRTEWRGLVFLRPRSEFSADERAFLGQLEPLMMHRFMSKLLTDTFVTSPLSGIFDLPNFTEVLKDFNESVQILGLCHSAAIDTIRDLLNIIASSYEWRNNPVWEVLSAQGLLTLEPVTIEDFGLKPLHWQEKLRRAALTTYENDEMVTTRYYFETADQKHNLIPRAVREFLSRADALGTKTTHFQYLRAFQNDILNTVDVVSAFNTAFKDDAYMRKLLLGKSRLINLHDLSPEDELFEEPFSLTVLNAKSDRGDALPDVYSPDTRKGEWLFAQALVADVVPYWRITFPHLGFVQQHPIQLIGNALTDKVSDGGAGVDASRPAWIDGEYKSYDGFRAFDLVDPAIYLTIEQDRHSYEPFSRNIRIPRNEAHLRVMIKQFGYTLLQDTVDQETYDQLALRALRHNREVTSDDADSGTYSGTSADMNGSESGS